MKVHAMFRSGLSAFLALVSSTALASEEISREEFESEYRIQAEVGPQYRMSWEDFSCSTAETEVSSCALDDQGRAPHVVHFYVETGDGCYVHDGIMSHSIAGIQVAFNNGVTAICLGIPVFTPGTNISRCSVFCSYH